VVDAAGVAADVEAPRYVELTQVPGRPAFDGQLVVEREKTQLILA